MKTRTGTYRFILCFAVMMALAFTFTAQPADAANLGKPVIKTCDVNGVMLTVKWKAAKKAKKYKVQTKIADLKGDTYHTEKTVKQKSGIKTYTLKLKLADYTKYKLRVVAIGKKGAQKASAVKKFYVEACEHDWIIKVIKQGSCTEKQVTRKTCRICGDKEETSEYLPHEFEDVVLTEPTCTVRGTKEQVCKNCGYKALGKKYIPAIGHNLQSTVYEPTPECPGYTETYCVNPGCKKVHTFSDRVPYTKDLDLSEETIKAKLAALKEKYPEESYWGAGSTYTSKYPRVLLGGKNASHVSMGACAGFAFMVQEELFGQLPERETAYENLRLGDRVSSVMYSQFGGDSHTEIVCDIQGDTFYTCGGNSGETVYWDSTNRCIGYKYSLEHTSTDSRYYSEYRFYTRYPEENGE